MTMASPIPGDDHHHSISTIPEDMPVKRPWSAWKKMAAGAMQSSPSAGKGDEEDELDASMWDKVSC